MPVPAAAGEGGSSREAPALQPDTAAVSVTPLAGAVGVAVPDNTSSETPSAAAAAAAAPSAGSEKGLKVDIGGVTCYPNSAVPTPFSNEFCSGSMLFLCVTDPPDARYEAHFAGRGIMFEIQIQGRLAVIPQGTLYMGAELAERPKWGLVTQALSSVVMRFASQLVKVLHYSFGDKKVPEDFGDAEPMHATFPLFRVMDRIVITPDGEAVPPLGVMIDEPVEERQARRAGKTPEPAFRTGATYTMAFHSGMVDFQKWAVVNVPGQGALSLNNFFGPQPIHMVLYDFLAPAGATAHKQRDKRYFFSAAICNDAPGSVATPPALLPSAKTALSAPGTPARSLALEPGAATGMSPAAGADVPSLLSPISTSGTEDDGMAKVLRFAKAYEAAAGTDAPVLSPSTTIVTEAFSPNNSAQPAATLEPLPICTRVVVLLQVVAEPDGSDSVQYIDEGGGDGVASAAVLRTAARAPPAFIWLLKAGGSTGTFRSDRIYDGDTVRVYHQEADRHLCTSSGGMLKWTTASPSAAAGYFIICAPGSAAGPHPPMLRFGCPFQLAIKRHPERRVALAPPRSAARRRGHSNTSSGGSISGGLPLGCFDTSRRGGALVLEALPWRDPFGMDGAQPPSPHGPFAYYSAVAGSSGFSSIRRLPLMAGPDDGDDDSDVNAASDGEGAPQDRREASGGEESASDLSDVDANSRAQLASPRIEKGSLEGGVEQAAVQQLLADGLHVEAVACIDMLHRGTGSGLLAFVLHCTTAAGRTSPSASTSTHSWLVLRKLHDLAFLGNISLPSVRGNSDLASPKSPPKPPLQVAASPLHKAEAINEGGTGADAQLGAPQGTQLKLHGSQQEQPGGQGTPELRPQADLAGGHEGGQAEQPKHSPVGGRLSRLPVPPGLGDSERSLRSVARKLRDLQMAAAAEVATAAAATPGTGSSSSAITAAHRSLAQLVLERRPFLDGSLLRARTAADLCVTPGIVSAKAGPSTVPMKRNSRTGPRQSLLVNAEALAAAAQATSERLEAGPSVIQGVAAVRLQFGDRWREEWVRLGASTLTSAPATTRGAVPAVQSWVPLSRGPPAWTLPISAIVKVDKLPEERCPLAGLFCLRLEAVYQVHYLAFRERDTRDIWLLEIQASIDEGHGATALDLGAPAAQSLVLSAGDMQALTDPAQAWPGSKRVILNARQAGFEVKASGSAPWEMTAALLRRVYSLGGAPKTSGLVAFLDAASELQAVDLSSLNKDSSAAVCFWVNAYHTLVRHALLVLGPAASARDWGSMHATASYLIGGEVFSLNELECCVLKGHLNVYEHHAPPKFWPAPPPKEDSRRQYACTSIDDRMHLALNNGTTSCVPRVYVLTPPALEVQMHGACTDAVREFVKVDNKKRVMHVPGALRGCREERRVQLFCMKFACDEMLDAFTCSTVTFTTRWLPESMRSHDPARLVLMEPPPLSPRLHRRTSSSVLQASKVPHQLVQHTSAATHRPTADAAARIASGTGHPTSPTAATAAASSTADATGAGGSSSKGSDGNGALIGNRFVGASPAPVLASPTVTAAAAATAAPDIASPPMRAAQVLLSPSAAAEPLLISQSVQQQLRASGLASSPLPVLPARPSPRSALVSSEGQQQQQQQQQQPPQEQHQQPPQEHRALQHWSLHPDQQQSPQQSLAEAPAVSPPLVQVLRSPIPAPAASPAAQRPGDMAMLPSPFPALRQQPEQAAAISELPSMGTPPPLSSVQAVSADVTAPQAGAALPASAAGASDSGSELLSEGADGSHSKRDYSTSHFNLHNDEHTASALVEAAASGEERGTVLPPSPHAHALTASVATVDGSVRESQSAGGDGVHTSSGPVTDSVAVSLTAIAAAVDTSSSRSSHCEALGAVSLSTDAAAQGEQLEAHTGDNAAAAAAVGAALFPMQPLPPPGMPFTDDDDDSDSVKSDFDRSIADLNG